MPPVGHLAVTRDILLFPPARAEREPAAAASPAEPLGRRLRRAYAWLDNRIRFPICFGVFVLSIAAFAGLALSSRPVTVEVSPGAAPVEASAGNLPEPAPAEDLHDPIALAP